MNGLSQAGGAEPGAGLAARWLVFQISDRKIAVSLERMVKILKQAETFPAPLSGREFKGIFYYNDKAVPVLDWEFLTGRPYETKDPGILIIELGEDLLGVQVEESAKVEHHALTGGEDEAGFWIDLDPTRGLWGLNVSNLFKALSNR
jgi:chemotaxis signal transduction protein